MIQIEDLLTTPFKTEIIPEIIHVIKNTPKPVDYEYVKTWLTSNKMCQGIDVQLQILELSTRGVININEGILTISEEVVI